MSYNPYQTNFQNNNNQFGSAAPQSSPFFASSGGPTNSGNMNMNMNNNNMNNNNMNNNNINNNSFGGDQQLFNMISQHGQAFISSPAANMVLQQGFTAAESYVEKNLSKYVTINKLKYYFAVDTSYVLNKLKLLLFPFAQKDWDRGFVKDPSTNSIVFSPPRQDVNAPDLYIPTMAFITYVLMVGFLLGVNNKFSIERLGVIASSALVWLFFEVVCISLAIYILNINCPIQTIDLISYCSYKYVGMILSIISLLFGFHTLYYLIFFYLSASLSYFLVKTLRVAMIEDSSVSEGNHHVKRKRYFLLVIIATQVLLSYYLTLF